MPLSSQRLHVQFRKGQAKKKAKGKNAIHFEVNALKLLKTQDC